MYRREPGTHTSFIKPFRRKEQAQEQKEQGAARLHLSRVGTGPTDPGEQSSVIGHDIGRIDLTRRPSVVAFPTLIQSVLVTIETRQNLMRNGGGPPFLPIADSCLRDT